MRKILAVTLLTVCMLCVGIYGYQLNDKSALGDSNDKVWASQEEESAANVEFDGSNLKEMGDESMNIETERKSKEDGDKLIIYSKPNKVIPLDINLEGYNNGKVTYAYIDGISFSSRVYDSDSVRIALEGDVATAGTHDVELVQYENDGPDSKVTSYHKLQYEVINN